VQGPKKGYPKRLFQKDSAKRLFQKDSSKKEFKMRLYLYI
tara:strand:- start:546 stop:665 length:120 start_codon:yes stop_codon:yes gene_type:complete